VRWPFCYIKQTCIGRHSLDGYVKREVGRAYSIRTPCVWATVSLVYKFAVFAACISFSVSGSAMAFSFYLSCVTIRFM